jgi:hypothetical protein
LLTVRLPLVINDHLSLDIPAPEELIEVVGLDHELLHEHSEPRLLSHDRQFPGAPAAASWLLWRLPRNRVAEARLTLPSEESLLFTRLPSIV